MRTAFLTALLWTSFMQAAGAQQAEAKSATERAQAAAKQNAAKQNAAKQAADDELKRQATKLIRQLDAAQISARDQAYGELVKLGPKVLEFLPTAADNPPATVRDAVRRLRQEFDRQAADAAMQAARVTLHGQGLTLANIVEDIQKQTGNKLVLDAPADTTIDLDLDQVPFWQALDTVAERAKLSIYSYAIDGLRLRPADPRQRPRTAGAFYSGPLRFEASEIRLQRDPRLDSDAALKVGLEISWEPRLRPISLRQQLDQLQAVDEKGNPIPVDGKGELPALVHQGSSAVELELPFVAPPRSVQQIASLRGTVDVLLPGKLESFEFTELDKSKKTQQQRHNATVTLDGVRKANNLWEFRVRVSYQESSSAFDSHLVSWILNNEAYLIDAEGERKDNGGFETTSRAENEIGVAYFFEVEGELGGYKFIYQTPSTIYQLPVKYELNELSLP